MLNVLSKISNGANTEKFKVNERASTVKLNNCHKIYTIKVVFSFLLFLRAENYNFADQPSPNQI